MDQILHHQRSWNQINARRTNLWLNLRLKSSFWMARRMSKRWSNWQIQKKSRNSQRLCTLWRSRVGKNRRWWTVLKWRICTRMRWLTFTKGYILTEESAYLTKFLAKMIFIWYMCMFKFLDWLIDDKKFIFIEKIEGININEDSSRFFLRSFFWDERTIWVSWLVQKSSLT